MPGLRFDLQAVDRPNRERREKRFQKMMTDRTTWDPHYKDLADHILPRHQRFDSSWRNRGSKRNDKIINDTATIARRTLASGMMAGLTAPSRPWFRLVTPDPSMMDAPGVRDWLHVVEERIRVAFHRSNIYNTLANLYGDLAVFGTAAFMTESDFDSVIRATSFPIGSFCLGVDAKGHPNTIFRDTSFTVEQLMEKFGPDNLSNKVKDCWTRGDYDNPIEIVHCVEPRRFRNMDRLDNLNKAFRSLWWEKQSKDHQFLGESGFQMFPVLAPRWDVSSSPEDVYGTSPAMDCLGDIKALQTMERRKAQILDKLTTPPMVAPASVEKKGGVSLLPGGTTWVPADAPAGKVYPAVMIDPRAVLIGEEIKKHEDRIERCFYADLFLLLAQSDLRQPRTATEIAELHEEKVLQLGPVLERLDDELFDPLIDRFFLECEQRGELPPAPDVLQGLRLKVEYTSVLAAAQKLLGIANIERFVGFVGNLAGVLPQALDKLDVDEVIDEYADKVGVPPRIIVSSERVAAIRAARAQQQQAAQMAAMAQPAKDATAAAVNLSKADTSGSSSLTRLLNVLGPRASAGVQAA
jgi:hypothetical protein